MSASKFFTGIVTKNPDNGAEWIPEQIEISVQVECYANDESGDPEGAIIKIPRIRIGETEFVPASATMDSSNYIIVGFAEKV